MPGHMPGLGGALPIARLTCEGLMLLSLLSQAGGLSCLHPDMAL